MPQSVVNMKVNTQNKDCRKLKISRFKMRHVAYCRSLWCIRGKKKYHKV